MTKRLQKKIRWYLLRYPYTYRARRFFRRHPEYLAMGLCF